MGHQDQINEKKFPSLMLDEALYCEEEEQWEEEDCFIEELDESTYCADTNVNSKSNPSILSPEQDLFWEEEELCSLFRKEEENNDLYNNGLKRNPFLAEGRSEAVEWILKVTAYYSFSASTAILATNYLDRFLFSCGSFQIDNNKPWMTQLAAVACLSLAAKVEETQVPLLLDLQVEESKYVFEAKTIQRMEILVLSTLQWKMNPVTSLSFVDFVMRRLGLKNHLCWEFLRRCECLLLSVISDCRFMCYLPSVMATATMLHVFDSVEPSLSGGEHQKQLFAILGINKDKVEECYRLIPVVASASYLHSSNKRKFRSVPGSPRGVMDMSFSSDSSSDYSWPMAAASVSSSPEPLSKRTRANAQEEDHAT
ncbi:hypothetical protein M9H77_32439 [Catharanthus roseus]|uniref:Uncharacterized protein n=1 Tax=Catharanthus roseus TaxID=4058 RepID=A0ACC0A466_CATRO|nr:hypothetical protein M9H77_32439 [Catharanthus roseus]